MKRRVVIGVVISEQATIDDINTLNARLNHVRNLPFVLGVTVGEEENGPGIRRARMQDVRVRRRARVG